MARHYSSKEVLLSLLAKSRAKETINDGDKVRLNIKKIKSRPDYDRMNDRYKQFVEENSDTVFTACVKSGRRLANVFDLKESDDGWLFWIGDLIKVK